MAFCLVDLNKSFTFASDDESQKRLVARHRVFFDANYSRTRRLERSLIRNPQNPQSPKLPLYKEELRFLPKSRKKRSNSQRKKTFLRTKATNQEMYAEYCFTTPTLYVLRRKRRGRCSHAVDRHPQ